MTQNHFLILSKIVLGTKPIFCRTDIRAVEGFCVLFSEAQYVKKVHFEPSQYQII